MHLFVPIHVVGLDFPYSAAYCRLMREYCLTCAVLLYQVCGLCCSNKSRLEEINEIIARSQVRAQQLLAAGTFYSPTVVTATTTSSAASVSVSRQPQTVTLSALVEHSGDEMPAGTERPCSQPLTTNDDVFCHVTSGEAAATEDSV